MFLTLLLAHFIADYPFQPAWMVRNKNRLWVLSLHVAVHLGVSLALVGIIRNAIWTQLCILALIHFWIDVGKNLVYRYHPNWAVGPYFIDQLCHYISIWIISRWIMVSSPPFSLPISSSWVILATGFLLVTHVWFITEKIIAHADAAYRAELNQQFLARMITRASLLAISLLIFMPFQSTKLAFSTSAPFPYLYGRYRRRALFTDLSVVFFILIFIRFAWFFQ